MLNLVIVRSIKEKSGRAVISEIYLQNKVYFKDNLFNYTSIKEQCVTNPKAKILKNFKAYNLTSRFSNATVATSEMNYGKGKVINVLKLLSCMILKSFKTVICI